MAVAQGRRSREESQAETRVAVLAAAEDEFDEKGYDGASVDAIARRAGFSKGAVYSNFESKEELFLAVSTVRDERLSAPLLAALEAARDLDGCVDAVDSWYRHQAHDESAWTLATAEFSLVALRKAELRARLAADHRTVRQSIAWLLATKTAELGHPLASDPEDLAEALIALAQGLSIAHAIDDQVSADVFPLAFRALLGLPPA